MYINFWYPVCLSDEINEGPKKATILGLDFVAFRDHEGTAHCLSNVCVHRGGSRTHCHGSPTGRHGASRAPRNARSDAGSAPRRPWHDWRADPPPGTTARHRIPGR